MPELLLEYLSEEIPARMQARAAEDLERLVLDGLKAAKLSHGDATAVAGPRRLALRVSGIPAAQPDLREERRGPRADAPAKAIEGFLRGAGVALEACERRETDKGVFLFAVIERRGRPTLEVLPEILRGATERLPWPKRMRWGGGSARWVRPLHAILALFDGKVVPFAFAGIAAGERTRGHRFLAPEWFAVAGYDDYRAKLEAAHVVLDAGDRRGRIWQLARGLAERENLTVVEDRGLLDELAGLVEWPVALLGRFEDSHLALPPEVIVTAMRAHQRYLALRRADGGLAPRFIAIGNMVNADGGALALAGYERVLKARLADARYFWDSDRKVRLADRVPALSGIVFHAQLGSMGEKVARLQSRAHGLATYIPGAERDLCRSAALLAKADLVSGMVGEFPELQGIMGRYYARDEGERPEVADAIAEHYAPQGPADRCPTAPVSVAVALADKLDTLVGFFAIGESPTGSRDPFALRRAALGVIRLIVENKLRVPLRKVLDLAAFEYEQAPAGVTWSRPTAVLLDFFADRLKVHLREQGVRHDLVAAVFALDGEDDLVRLLARAEALQRFLETDDGANLLTAYRRAANIVRIEEKKDGRTYDGEVDPHALREPEERTLADRLEVAALQSQRALEREDLAGAMAALAALRRPVDAFFDKVTVNAADTSLRVNRLRLLSGIRTTLNRVADFAMIEG
jgi:glycyl-tRNA synthetase beta chain